MHAPHPKCDSGGWRSDYFRSGWAFFLPYTVTYLIYAATGWSVQGLPLSPDRTGLISTAGGLLPSLRSVYLFLHAIHLLLAGTVALQYFQRRFWSKSVGPKAKIDESPKSEVIFLLFAWILLALFFWIPGLDWEWPNDTWEHLRRINEWRGVPIVADHTAWEKSSYLLAYSLTFPFNGSEQLKFLNLYYTGMCLLLGWQFYRLGLATGLNRAHSFLFVMLNAVTFGNSIFSFYRYYGLSSSILAHIGTIAIIRLVLESVTPAFNQSDKIRPSGTLSSLNPAGFIGAILFLILLIAFNHRQGLLITGLGVVAILIWRLISWKRTALFWLGGVASLLSLLAVISLSRNDALQQIIQSGGWFSAWYGFDLFNPDSIAANRTYQILGLFGLLNLFVAIVLILKNHVCGWLTLTPILALSLPCFALPFAQVLLADGSTANMVVFHRVVFAVPASLALVCLLQQWPSLRPEFATRFKYPIGVLGLIPVALLGLLGVRVDAPGYNRLWQAVRIPPDDLQLAHFLPDPERDPDDLASGADHQFVTTPLGSNVIESFFPTEFRVGYRPIHSSPFQELEARVSWFRPSSSGASTQDFGSTSPPECQSPVSLAGTLLPEPAERLFSGEQSLRSDKSAAPWLIRRGLSVERIDKNGHKVIGNVEGELARVFTPELIPVTSQDHYTLGLSIRALQHPESRNYLAVAWYDRDGNWLRSSVELPTGGHRPRGWTNTKYSLFGLTGQSPPREWTRYSIQFGRGEPAQMPTNARYLRIGALLNEDETPDALIEIKDATIHRLPPPRFTTTLIPPYTALTSAGSQTAYLSGHWNAQKVAAEHVGLHEFDRYIRQHFNSTSETVTP